MSLPRPNRRVVLAALGAGLASAACTPARPPDSNGAPSAPGAPACVLTPEGTEGPYYVDNALVRSDIREGRPGVPVELRFEIVDADRCRPLPDAAVDIWHADASGRYSGVGDLANRRFLRGVQHTDGNGIATFRTIFPGWYDNRTVHYHVKVHVGGEEIHTGQLYFTEPVTQAVIASGRPYSERTGDRTTNEDDFLFDRGDRALLTAHGDPERGYRTTATLGVRP